MYCPKCGNAIRQPDSNFCVECGAPLQVGVAVAPRSVDAAATVARKDEGARTPEPFVPTRPHKWLYRLSSLALFGAGVTAFSYAFSFAKVPDPAGRIGFIVGYYFWVPFIVYWIWRSAFKKRKGLGILLCSVAFALIAAYQSIKIVGEAKENHRELAAVQKILPELIRGDPVSDTEFSSAGSLKPALVSMRDLYNSIRADAAALIKQQNAPDFVGMLKPDNLTNVASIDRALSELNQYRQTLVLTQASINADIDAFSKTIGSLDMPEDVKSSFESGAKPGLQAVRTSMAEFMRIETDFCSAATDMMEFMKHSQGRFVIRNDRLAFARDADAQLYNSRLSTLRKLAQEEADWRQAQLVNNAKLVDHLKHLSE